MVFRGIRQIVIHLPYTMGYLGAPTHIHIYWQRLSTQPTNREGEYANPC